MTGPPSAPRRGLLGPLVAVVVLGAGSALYNRGLRPAPGPPRAAPQALPSASSAPAAGLPFDLVEASAQAGLVFTHRKVVLPDALRNVAPWIASVGVGVAVADVDGDGRPDVYVTSTEPGSRNALFLNKGGGTFREAAGPAGLADVNAPSGSMRPLFFDFDNDGDKDLVLSTIYCLKAFKNDGRGTFSAVAGAAGIDYCGPSYATSAADLDSDGDLDLVVAGYFPPVDLAAPATLDIMQDSLTMADNGGETVVYRNDGKGGFSRWPGNLGVSGRRWNQDVAAYDFQDDGLPDLYFAVDYNQDRVLINRGGGRFEDFSASVSHKYSRSGMNADVAELDASGRPSVLVTHIYEPPYKLGPNTLWTWVGGKAGFEERGTDSGIGSCGWAWGGRFVDLDLDGWQDLVVTNGFISADPKKSYWYRMSVLAGSSAEVLSNVANWPPMDDYSMSGYQRKCVFRNEGGRFRMVTHQTGMAEDLSDGRAVAAIDADDDGVSDLVMGNQGQPLRFYRTLTLGKPAWIGFKLVGTRSNRDAWGSRVRLRFAGKTLTRQLWPANSFMSQSDDRLVFGLGDWRGDPVVEVRWPSGVAQTLGPLAPGRYHRLVEPP